MSAVSALKNHSPVVHKVLHVNTPPPLLRLVERFCQARKFSVESMESGSSAFHHALVKPYQLILVGSPLSGMDVTRLLAGLSRAGINTPVLVMMETRLMGKTDFSKFSNCIGVLAKPLDLSEFAKYLDIVGKPVEISPPEMEHLLAVLRKWEIRMNDEA